MKNAQRFTNESVERALTQHFGRERWQWFEDGDRGPWARGRYVVETGVGALQLTLTEAYCLVAGAAEQKRLAEGSALEGFDIERDPADDLIAELVWQGRKIGTITHDAERGTETKFVVRGRLEQDRQSGDIIRSTAIASACADEVWR